MVGAEVAREVGKACGEKPLFELGGMVSDARQLQVQQLQGVRRRERRPCLQQGVGRERPPQGGGRVKPVRLREERRERSTVCGLLLLDLLQPVEQPTVSCRQIGIDLQGVP
ncbi:MAG: hypothetical protein P8Y07_02490 [Gemmatimonadales bacterium]